MTIQSGDVKLLKSSVMADVPEGGGAPTGTVIPDGVSNAIFPDISELDRAGGRVNLRKVFAKVDTLDTDSYFGTNVIVAEPPKDPRVAVTLFSTESTFDERDDARTRIESFLYKGTEWGGFLFENHVQGQRVIQLFQRLGSAIPVVGQTLVLTENEGQSNEKEQYVRVTAASGVRRTFTYQVQDRYEDYEALVVTVDISDALRFDFTGSPAVRNYLRASNSTKVRDTVVADAARYFGVTPVAQAVSLGAFTVTAESVYSQLVPSAQVETPIADSRANQQVFTLVESGDEVVQSFSHAFTTTNSLFIGGGILPGSLSVVRDGITLTDKGGVLIRASDLAEVGTVDYANGVMALVQDVWGTGEGNYVVTFKPALTPVAVTKSYAIPVTLVTQRLSYVLTLDPAPAHGSLEISYRSGGRWYVLRDQGSGQIAGATDGIGVGTLNFTTGTVSLTLAALPDIGSKIIFQWAQKEVATKASTILTQASDPLNQRFFIYMGVKDAGGYSKPLKPGSVTITWNDGQDRTVTDNAQGILSGYGVGKITYSSGEIRLSPTTLPPKGTQVTVSVIDTTSTLSQVGTFADGGSNWTFSLGGYVQATTVELAVAVQHVVRNFGNIDIVTPRVLKVFDDANGNLVVANITGNLTVGTINYTTGECTLAKSVAGFKDVQHRWQAYNPIDDGDPLPLWTQLSDETRTVTLAFLNGYATGLASPAWGWWTGSLTQAAQARFGAAEGGPYTQVFEVNTIAAQGPWLRFYLGDALHVNAGLGNAIHRDPLPSTGLGTPVGTHQSYWSTYNYSNFGYVELTSWVAGISPQFNRTSGVVASPLTGPSQVVDRIVFRTAVAPLRNGSFSLVGTMQSGQNFNITADSAGVINATVANSQWVPSDFPLSTPGSWSNPTVISGTVDYDTGVVEVRFGGSGANADTLRYNATAYSYLPLDADLLGLDPVRLPQDGRVPIFRTGEFAVVGHTGEITATFTNGQTVDCGRVRLSRVRVVGADGVVINTGYTTDLEAGTVSITDVTGWVQPATIEHRIEDMAMVREVQITGQITFTRALTHDYPLGSYVSSALVAGDRFARVSTVFDQATWNGAWTDEAVGSSATATFNSVAHPITVTNRGALTERWAIRFTNSTSFEVIGEHVGVIATGNTSTDCAPLNPNTGVPYFTIPALGWGNGWSTGSVLRFNTIGAEFPVWVVRTVQQGPETVTNDDFTILIRGDVDTP